MKLARISIAKARIGWSRFAVDRRGAMAMTLGLLMTGFAGMTALSVDVADWYGSRRIMQAAADAGAMGGALALKNGDTNAQAISAATTDAQLNATGLGAGATVTATVSASSQVKVTLTKKATLLLSGLFLSTAPTITATATAGVVPLTTAGGTPMCLLVTSPAAANVVVLSGSSSIQASGCGMVVNSTSTSAINLSGNTVINSKSLCGPGGHNVSGSSRLNPAEINCPAVADPYANMPVPSVASASNPCMVTNFQTTGNNYYQYVDQNGITQTNTSGANTMTSGVRSPFYYATPGNTQSALHLTPGIFCGGINLGAFTNVVFDSGIYVMRNGGLNTSGNTTASGSGVAFYLTGTGTAVQLQNDFVDLSAQTTLTITAPTSGAMAGIAIYQDNSAATGTLTNTLSGNSTINFTGLLYFGNQNVTVSGSSENQSAGFTAMIAYTLNYSGFSTLYLNSNYSSTTVPVPTGLTSVSQPVVALTQ
jgi:Flp pilus assembly protein TadG